MPAHDEVFIAGYEKGRADGIAAVQAIVFLVIDNYPAFSETAAENLMKGGRALAQRIIRFGDSCSQRAVREERKKRKNAAPDR